MFNAIIPDRLLHDIGVFKERLSQSALYFETVKRRMKRQASLGPTQEKRDENSSPVRNMPSI